MPGYFFKMILIFFKSCSDFLGRQFFTILSNKSARFWQKHFTCFSTHRSIKKSGRKNSLCQNKVECHKRTYGVMLMEAWNRYVIILVLHLFEDYFFRKSLMAVPAFIERRQDGREGLFFFF